MNIELGATLNQLDLTSDHTMIAAVTGAIVNNSGAAGNVAATYIGLPVISFGMEEYVNGNINGTLANFASVFSYGFTAAIKLPVN